MIAAIAAATGIAPRALLDEEPEMIATIAEILARRR
jgi:hypothetical protein